MKDYFFQHYLSADDISWEYRKASQAIMFGILQFLFLENQCVALSPLLHFASSYGMVIPLYLTARMLWMQHYRTYPEWQWPKTSKCEEGIKSFIMEWLVVVNQIFLEKGSS